MNKISNIVSIFFNKIRPIKWLVAIVLGLVVLLTYSNTTGWHWGSSGANQSWNASGPGYHK